MAEKVYSAHGAGNETRASERDCGHQMALGLDGLGRGVRRHRGRSSDEQEGRGHPLGASPQVVLDHDRQRRMERALKEGRATRIRNLARRAPLQGLVNRRKQLRAVASLRDADSEGSIAPLDNRKEAFPNLSLPKGGLSPAVAHRMKEMRKRSGNVLAQDRPAQRAGEEKPKTTCVGTHVGRAEIRARRQARRGWPIDA